MSDALKTVAVTVEYAGREFPAYSHVIKYEAALKIVRELEQQVAHLSLYKPARRTEQTPEPVKAIGPCNEPFWFKGIRETDEEFAERAGTEVEE